MLFNCMSLVVLSIIFIIKLTYGYDTDYTKQYVSIPAEQYFNDPSALNVKSNLQSKQYHDFIHTLYRYDKINLHKVDQLFENAGTTVTSTSATTSSINGKLTSSKNLLSPPPPPPSSHYQRNKREIVFRPLFLYHEQAAKKEHIPEKYPYHYQHKKHYEPVVQNENYFYPDYPQNVI